jgi:hypothetical protein
MRELPSDAQERLRVLLCWGYHRAGWIQPFEQLRDRFDVSYLFFRTRGEEEACLTDAPRHYWAEFRDARAVIDAIRPDRVVFMALDGAWSIALNAAARGRGVPTFIVQHGHLESTASSEQLNAVAALSKGSPLPAVRFAASTFGVRGLVPMARLLRFMADARRRGARDAMPRHRFPERIPDRYIALSPESAAAHVRLDGIEPGRISCIGLPEHDRLFSTVPREVPSNGSVLLLDSPNAENRWGVTTTTIEEKRDFLTSVATAAATLGRPFRVKLHPETYAATWLPDLAGVTYVRDADIAEEIASSSICLGFDSTLLIPAIWLRPTIAIRLRPSRIVDLAAELGAATVLSAMSDFEGATFVDAETLFHAAAGPRAEYVQRLAFQPDGRAVERLAALIEAPVR